MKIVEILLFATALLVVGLVVLALLWSGTGPYQDLIKGPPGTVNCIQMFDRSGGETCYEIPRVAEIHQAWAAYETGGTDQPPTFADVRFTDDEYAHMADVRRVFDGAKFLVPLGLLVIIIRLQRSRARGPLDMWRLVRDGSLAAAVVVVVVGVVATFAFEPLFLLFHYVFFPQGNFLFDPATSNLVRLYPDWYWEGITVRVGASFLAAALALAALAHLRVGRLLA